MPWADYRDLGVANRLTARCIGSAHGVSLVTTAWRRGEHPERSEGHTPYAAIEIMRRGTFEKRNGRTRLFVDGSEAVFFAPGERFEIRHPLGQENSGITLRIDDTALDEIRTSFAGEVGFQRSAAPLPSALRFEAEQLVAEFDASDAVTSEEKLLDFARRAIAMGCREAVRDREPTRSERDRIEFVRRYLAEAYATPLRLNDIAAVAGCSVWHISKMFRRVTGSSLHAWLRRMRLRVALAALHDGVSDLTTLALAVGFSHHSHFTAAFRTEYGMTPSAARSMLRPRPQ